MLALLLVGKKKQDQDNPAQGQGRHQEISQFLTLMWKAAGGIFPPSFRGQIQATFSDLMVVFYKLTKMQWAAWCEFTFLGTESPTLGGADRLLCLGAPLLPSPLL